DCRVPRDWRRVRNEEAMVTIQHTQAPRGKNQKRSAWKKYSHQRDRQRSSLFLETSGNQRDDVRSCKDADQNDDGRDQRENREDGVGDASCLFLVTLRQQLCVDRNKRRGESALAKHVLQEIRNSKRSAERVAFSRTAEVVSKDPLSD